MNLDEIHKGFSVLGKAFFFVAGLILYLLYFFLLFAFESGPRSWIQTAAFLGEYSNDDVEAYTQCRHFVLSI
jgi:hypothetical protein